jgi:FkbH-like protein
MSVDRLGCWREPIDNSWRTQCAALLKSARAGAEAAGGEGTARFLRRFSAMRLEDRDRLMLTRLSVALRAADATLPGFRKLRILMVGNSNLGFLGPALEASGFARALWIEPVETGFDSVMSLAIDPSMAVPEGNFDAVVLFLSTTFLSRPAAILDPEAEEACFSENESRIAIVTAGLRKRFHAPVVVASFSPPAHSGFMSADLQLPGSLARQARHANQFILQEASVGRCLHFDLAGLVSDIGTELFDPVRYHVAKLPFSLSATPTIADRLSALLAANSGTSPRVIVVDLDNTLWGGVFADDGIEGIRIGQGTAEGEAFGAFQDFLIDLRNRGFLLAVCSKNVEAIARLPFERHEEMRLKLDHFSAFTANFDDKATNLRRIAEALQLGTASMLFLDDNPAERERVRASLPFVATPEIGDEPSEYIRTIMASGYLEHLPLTREDANRADAYRGRATAMALQAETGDYASYLASLKMVLSVRPFDSSGRARIVNLIQKSNQFNLTTRRRSELEVAALESDPEWLCWQARLTDRFADHGMISVLIVRKGTTIWDIDTWIMSCRVLQREVESALMDRLINAATDAGAVTIEGVYIPTERNGLVADFFDRYGFLKQTEINGQSEVKYKLPIIQWRRPDLPFSQV